MADKRKLQGEIDRCLKKIQEGIEAFDDIWKKVHSTNNTNQKEKFEADLKKEIKKLQRLRDQIKTWVVSADIKDKETLLEHRKKIESKMEQFKVIERETKTKAYSKEGLLGATGKVDPKEKEKEDITNWLQQAIASLNVQADAFESEIEAFTSRRKKLDKEDQARFDHCKERLDKHRYHIIKLEAILRKVDNAAVQLDQIQKIRDEVEYYIESHEEPDYVESDIYAELDLEDVLPSELLASSPSESDGDLGGGGLGGGATTSSNHSESPSPLAVTGSGTAHSKKGEEEKRRPKQTDDPSGGSGAKSLMLKISPSNSVTSAATGGGVNKVPPTPTKLNTPSAPSTPGGGSDAAVPRPSLVTSSGLGYAQVAGSHHSSTSTANKVVPASPKPPHLMSAGGLNGLIPPPSLVPPPPASLLQSPSAASSAAANRQQPPGPTPPPAPAATPSPAPQAPPTQGGGAQTLAGLAASSMVGAAVSGSGPGGMQQYAAAAAQQQQAHSQQQQMQLFWQQQQQVGAGGANAVNEGEGKRAVNGLGAGGGHGGAQGGESVSGLASLRTLAHSAAGGSGGGPERPGGAYMDGEGGATTSADPGSSADNASNNGVLSDPKQQQLSAASAAAAAAASSAASADQQQQQQHQQQLLAQQQQLQQLLAPPPPPPPATQMIHLSPLLGVAPLGPQPVSKEHIYRQKMLESAYVHLPYPCDSEKVRHYFPNNPCPTPQWYPQTSPPLLNAPEFFNKMDTDSLFFMFYYMEGTKAQYMAAKALKLKSWRFHTKYMMWFQRHEEPKTITEEFEQGTYIYFDYEKWGQRKKEGFRFEYKFLEDQELA